MSAINGTTSIDLPPPNPPSPSKSPSNTNASDSATRLAEAIDDFLGDLERKFKTVSDEILGKLDEMADRCDRLEQEMMLRETGTGSSATSIRRGSAPGQSKGLDMVDVDTSK